MLVRAIWLSIFIIAAQPALADSAGKRETLATQTCLTEHPNAEHLCFSIAFYTCMGEQLAIAANPNLAEERCLFQEQFVWGNLIEKACNEFKSIFEVETTKWDTLCHNNNGINWSDFTKEIKCRSSDLI